MNKEKKSNDEYIRDLTTKKMGRSHIGSADPITECASQFDPCHFCKLHTKFSSA